MFFMHLFDVFCLELALTSIRISRRKIRSSHNNLEIYVGKTAKGTRIPVKKHIELKIYVITHKLKIRSCSNISAAIQIFEKTMFL